MEEKKTFTVIDTRSNSKKFFESKATTVGELKAELAAMGIDTHDMAIQEGLTHTEFKNDSEVLPTNVNYKGVTTNNLVFRLTKAEKKIDSGSRRLDLYKEIKDHNLQDEVKEAFGKNYTQVKTDELEQFLSEFHLEEDETEKDVCTPAPCSCTEDPICKALIELAEDLYKHNCITYSTYNTVMSLDKSKSPYSDKELNEMFL